MPPLRIHSLVGRRRRGYSGGVGGWAMSGASGATPTELWRTGDRVTRDEEGYLHFEGPRRGRDHLGGFPIGPFEVESALVSHSSVAEAAVVAPLTTNAGHIARAVVVLRDGHEPSEQLRRDLQDHVKQCTAPYKYPAHRRLRAWARRLPFPLATGIDFERARVE
jgi:acyl-coenzyme A synthetase/AMP-(fatty) acid ligase